MAFLGAPAELSETVLVINSIETNMPHTKHFRTDLQGVAGAILFPRKIINCFKKKSYLPFDIHLVIPHE